MAKRAGTTHTTTTGTGTGTANIVGVDPHKRTLTASVLDGRGGVLATAAFRVSGDGHRAMEAWALGLGPVDRWGIEGASGLGRHTAMYLIGQGHDVRDVCPTRTAEQSRRRRQGKSDALDSVRIARETQADADIPVAFKRAGGDAGPDEATELIGLWHKARRSLLKSRQHLLNEAEALPCELPEALRSVLPDTSEVRPRLAALAGRDRSMRWDAATALRLRLLDDHCAAVADLDAREREATRELGRLIKGAVPPWGSCAASPIAPRPSCWSRSVIPVVSPRVASPASTGPHRCPPPRRRARGVRPGIGSTGAATAG